MSIACFNHHNGFAMLNNEHVLVRNKTAFVFKSGTVLALHKTLFLPQTKTCLCSDARHWSRSKTRRCSCSQRRHWLLLLSALFQKQCTVPVYRTLLLSENETALLFKSATLRRVVILILGHVSAPWVLDYCFVSFPIIHSQINVAISRYLAVPGVVDTR